MSKVYQILTNDKTKELWSETVEVLKNGKEGKKMPLPIAIKEAQNDILWLLDENWESLYLDKDFNAKEKTVNRMRDLEIYCACA